MHRLLSRLRHLEEQASADAWQDARGLSSLLTAARLLPPLDPCDLDSEWPKSGMHQLLEEARQERRFSSLC